MRHLVRIAAAMSLMAGAAACAEGAGQAGSDTSRRFPVTTFTQIETAGAYDVQVTTGQAPSMIATGPRDLIDRLEIEQRGDRLIIRNKRESGIGRVKWSNGRVRVAVTVPMLGGAAMAGSGDMRIDRIAGARFAGSVAGSGGLLLDRVEVSEIGLSLAGSGAIKAIGSARRATYSIAGSGDIDASGLTAAQANASVAGSGDLSARVTGQAQARVMGSGDITIRGGARCSVSKMGSGDVRCS